MKELAVRILKKSGVGGILSIFFGKESALKYSGWFRSVRSLSSVDRHGNPLPWLTYPLIHFLEPRLKKTFNVFEYGSGNSTLWFAQRVAAIKSIEYHKGWYNEIKSKMPGNAQIQLVEIKDSDIYAHLVFKSVPDSNSDIAYVNAVKADDTKYDLIVIDGLFRLACIESCLSHLKDDGVFLIDNTDYKEYAPSVEFLKGRGFRGLDFWGMCPIVSKLSCTSIYYKDNNCLNI